MKKIFFSLCSLFAITVAVSAQENLGNQQNRENQQDIQQQLPPRETQLSTEKAARQADVNAQNNKNVRAAEDKVRAETERSTGKEMKNPAETNPKTVKPPVLSDPVSAPINGK